MEKISACINEQVSLAYYYQMCIGIGRGGIAEFSDATATGRYKIISRYCNWCSGIVRNGTGASGTSKLQGKEACKPTAGGS